MLLTTKQVQEQTGLSQLRIRRLIQIGKLNGIDTGVGKRSYFQVTQEALDAFLSGAVPAKQTAIKPTRQSNRRIDADVPKVFG